MQSIHVIYALIYIYSCSRAALGANSRRIPKPPSPTYSPPSAQFPNPSRRVRRRRILIPDQRLQQPPHPLAPRTRRIVVDGEHADGAEATAADDGGLAGQGAVAVDARVCSGGDDGAIAEEAGGGIVDGGIDLRAAGHAGLDERRTDAVGVFEGGDFGVVDVDAVAKGGLETGATIQALWPAALRRR